MKGNDLIQIGFFSAIDFVIVFMSAMLGRGRMQMHFEKAGTT